jgi:hypothetical protein
VATKSSVAEVILCHVSKKALLSHSLRMIATARRLKSRLWQGQTQLENIVLISNEEIVRDFIAALARLLRSGNLHTRNRPNEIALRIALACGWWVCSAYPSRVLQLRKDLPIQILFETWVNRSGRAFPESRALASRYGPTWRSRSGKAGYTRRIHFIAVSAARCSAGP